MPSKPRKGIIGGSGRIPVAKNFLDLYDVPDDYAGQAGKVVKVNDAENALEFGEGGGGGGSFSGVFLFGDETQQFASGSTEEPIIFVESSPNTFDVGDWWNSGDPTKITIPANVNYIRISWIIRLFQDSGNLSYEVFPSWTLVSPTRDPRPFNKNPYIYVEDYSGASVNNDYNTTVSAPIPVEEGDSFTIGVTNFETGILFPSAPYWVSVEKVG